MVTPFTILPRLLEEPTQLDLFSSILAQLPRTSVAPLRMLTLLELGISFPVPLLESVWLRVV